MISTVSSTRKKGSCWSRSIGGHKDDRGTGAPLLQWKAEGAGGVQAEDSGDTFCSLPRELINRWEMNFLHWQTLIEQVGDLGETSGVRFSLRGGEGLALLPGAVAAPYLEVPEATEGPCAAWAGGQPAYGRAGGWETPSNPTMLWFYAECVMYVPIFCYGAGTNRICSLNLLAATVKQRVLLWDLPEWWLWLHAWILNW